MGFPPVSITARPRTTRCRSFSSKECPRALTSTAASPTPTPVPGTRSSMNSIPPRDSGHPPIPPLPNRFNATGIYEFPFGHGRTYLKTGMLSHVVGNWQVALTYDFQQGPFLSWGNNFYYGDMNTIGDTLAQGTKTLDRWFNTSAQFERNSANQPAAYQARVFPVDITSVRADGLNQWNANLRRDFRLREGTIFEVRVDALNLLNRSQFAAPDNTTFGKVTSTTSTLNRFYQIQGRIRF